MDRGHRGSETADTEVARFVLQTGHVPELGYDRDRSVHAQVSDQAALRPDAVAVEFGSARLTYRELDGLSAALAARLAELGVAKGDVVGLFLPRSLQAIVAMLAILRAGAAYAPFDPAYPDELLEYMISESAPKALFVDSRSREKIRSLNIGRGRILDLEAELAALDPNDAEPPGVAVSGGDAAYVMYTSGSTGRPKGVVVTHRAIARVVRGQNYVSIAPDDVMLHTATISFDAATFEIWGALLNGARIAGVPDGPFSLPLLSRVIRESSVTVTFLTTGLFNLLVDYQKGELRSLRHVLFGGEVGSAEHAKKFVRAYPDCRLTNAYGPTEVTVFSTAYDVPKDFTGDELPIGRAIAYTGVHVLDENLRELPPGTEGQLALSGDGLAIGYLNRPDLTAERFVTILTASGEAIRCYLTGDLAVLGEDGSVRFRGRRDRQIKLNGRRIELDEIETALRRDRRLADAIVVCRTDGPAKRIVAYLRPEDPAAVKDAGLPQAVLSDLRNVLPAYMIPSAAVVLSEYPLNLAGKVDRWRLPPPPDEAAAPAAAASAESSTEAVLTRLWRDILKRESIEPNHNFFDLGGTSLQLMRVHAGLEEALGRTIDIVLLFQHPTIRDLARHLDGQSQSTAQVLSAASRADLRRKTFSQFRRSAP